MLTSIYLEGALGRNFGREWKLDIHTPLEALQLINANIPRFGQWIRQNMERYDRLMVLCKYADGRIEALDNNTVLMERDPVEIHFTPLVQGSGKVFQWIASVVMIIVGAVLCYFCPPLGAAILSAGIGMLTSCIVTALMGKQKKNETTTGTSFYFNGAENTTQQGVPVPLIFGRCKVGSAVISSSIIASDSGSVVAVEGKVERVPDKT